MTQINRLVTFASENLKYSKSTKHFEVFYAIHNDPLFGYPYHGVFDTELVTTVLNTLEEAHTYLADLPGRSMLSPNSRFPVRLLNIGRFVRAEALYYKSCIYLSTRSRLPTREYEELWMRTCVAHELIHVFNDRLKPLYFQPPNWDSVGQSRPWSSVIDSWEWFDEATAMMFERYLVPESYDYLKYLVEWVDEPHIALLDSTAHYRLGVFAQFLEQTLGQGFVNKVWVESYIHETAVEALERLIPANSDYQFISSDPFEKDILSSYYRDVFFIFQKDHWGSPIAERFGSRFIRRIWESSAISDQAQYAGEVGDGGCDYFRVNVENGTTSLRIQLKTTLPSDSIPFKVEIIPITQDKPAIAERYFLKPQNNLLTEEFSFDLPDQSYLVIIVTNCSLKTIHETAYQAYELKISEISTST